LLDWYDQFINNLSNQSIPKLISSKTYGITRLIYLCYTLLINVSTALSNVSFERFI